MATFLAHLKVKSGSEAAFEQTAAALQAATHENEKRMLRYEYWRGPHYEYWRGLHYGHWRGGAYWARGCRRGADPHRRR